MSEKYLNNMQYTVTNQLANPNISDSSVVSQHEFKMAVNHNKSL